MNVPHCSAEPELLSTERPTCASAIAEPTLTLAGLLRDVDELSAITPHQRRIEDQLVRSRLGVTSALFVALRAKHPPTARHSLRVALRSTLIGELVGLDAASLNLLEAAALLHDIGKLGVPDHLLNKATRLMPNEMAVVREQRCGGLEILRNCLVPPEIVEIIRRYPEPFDAQIERDQASSDESISCCARILAIADAFDAMTTDRIYRPALSRERAVAELFESAGTQFDPELVEQFCWASPQTESQIQQRVSLRWAQPDSSHWAAAAGSTMRLTETAAAQPSGPAKFQQQLLDGMHDGVVFVDSSWKIALWNPAAEWLTGMPAESMLEQEWHSRLIDLRDTEGNLIRDSRCPVQQVIELGHQVISRATLTRPSGERLTVDLHVLPVNDEHQGAGAIVLLRDASSETHMEAQLQDLSEQATTDSLTAVSNRAAFDEAHGRLVDRGLAQGATFSIILCDIDRFKQVNDRFGHQAGDQVLVQFARLLQRCSRGDDVVARYGGEEFVLLCPECDNATAARRAEQIRFELARLPQPALEMAPVTASFGVTELQPGDTAESMLRRADRALYQAKDAGRNQVVQLGVGLSPNGWRRELDVAVLAPPTSLAIARPTNPRGQRALERCR